MNFNSLCQKLIDNWLANERQEKMDPEVIYGAILPSLSIRSRLSIIDVTDSDPGQWILRTVRRYRLPGKLIDFDAFIPDGRLCDIKDQAYLEKSVYPSYLRAVEQKMPVLDCVEAKIVGIKVVYDRIVIPQKNARQPQWLIIFTYGRFMAWAPGRTYPLDSTDQAITIALINGMTSKEVALQVGLSPRTVEHRIERLKKLFEAKNLPHLTALLVAAGFDRAIRYEDDK